MFDNRKPVQGPSNGTMGGNDKPPSDLSKESFGLEAQKVRDKFKSMAQQLDQLKQAKAIPQEQQLAKQNQEQQQKKDQVAKQNQEQQQKKDQEHER